MAYVSNVLTHWIGRGKHSDEQYEILKEKILKKKELMYNKCPWQFPAQKSNMPEGIMIPMISFADIPFSESSSHCSKYSRFGISFCKSYLASRLACPVGYIINPFIYDNYVVIQNALCKIKSMLPTATNQEIAVEYIDDVINRFQYMMCFMENYSKENFWSLSADRKWQTDYVGKSYFEDNTALYYEREWRMVLSDTAKALLFNVERDGKTFFKYDEQYIKWIIVPRQYLERLKIEQDDVFSEY
ncbi:MAG: abortive infection system antitoxin AbiGi family protein, partial [Planctomycetota bacterium]